MIKIIAVKDGKIIAYSAVQNEGVTIQFPECDEIIEIDENMHVEVGWPVTDGVPVAPSRAYDIVAADTFYLRFSVGERAGIKASQDPIIAEIFATMNLWMNNKNSVDPNRQDVQAMLRMLDSADMLDEREVEGARIQEILMGT